MKIVIECVIISKYCFRGTKIDLKHTFLIRYYDSGHFRPNTKMSKNANFRYLQ
eukprot:UN11157